jgi:hypothetical protein
MFFEQVQKVPGCGHESGLGSVRRGEKQVLGPIAKQSNEHKPTYLITFMFWIIVETFF